MGNSHGKEFYTMAVGAMANVTKFDREEVTRLRDKFVEIAKRKGDPNTIDAEEFTEAMYSVGIGGEDAGVLRRIFAVVDADLSGGINLREFIVGLSMLTRGSAAERIKFAFSMADSDHDGKVSAGDLRAALGHMRSACEWFGDQVPDDATLDALVADAMRQAPEGGSLSLQSFANAVAEHPEMVRYLVGAGKAAVERAHRMHASLRSGAGAGAGAGEQGEGGQNGEEAADSGAAGGSEAKEGPDENEKQKEKDGAGPQEAGEAKAGVEAEAEAEAEAGPSSGVEAEAEAEAEAGPSSGAGAGAGAGAGQDSDKDKDYGASNGGAVASGKDEDVFVRPSDVPTPSELLSRENGEGEGEGEGEYQPVPRCRPVVVCGPSGVGKSAMIYKLLAKRPDVFGFSVSHTTRVSRGQEQDGVDYSFVTREQMLGMIGRKEFIEHAEVHRNLYGTSRAAVDRVCGAGRVCLLDIDVQGVRACQDLGLDVGRYVFVTPPPGDVLETRLRGRGTESEEQLGVRLGAARREAEQARGLKWDTWIVNDDLDVAAEELDGVLGAPRRDCLAWRARREEEEEKEEVAAGAGGEGGSGGEGKETGAAGAGGDEAGAIPAQAGEGAS